MEPNHKKSVPNQGQRVSGTPFSIRNLLPGLAIGILLGIAGVLAYLNRLPQITKTLHAVTIISFGVVVVTFLAVFVFRQFITRQILGNHTAGDFLNDAQAVTDTVTDHLAKNLLTNLPPETGERVRSMLPRLANWFFWGRLRNWWWNWILGIFVSLGGLTGTLLLINQNELLEAQNKKIDQQTELMNRQMLLEEANRRSALVVLMSNIMDKVDREIEIQQKGLTSRQKENREYTLSQSLIGQIAALSHSFKPYRYMEGDTLIGKPISPERGQLLITLTLLPLDTSTFIKIYKSATFESAGLRGAVLSEAYLSRAYLKRANLSGADLGGADLDGAWLSETNLSNTSLRRANLNGAYLSWADLSWADLSEADLSSAYLGETNLNGANLVAANLNEANLNGADLSWADLSAADLSWANLSEADLSRTDLSRTDLSWVFLNFTDLSW